MFDMHEDLRQFVGLCNRVAKDQNAASGLGSGAGNADMLAAVR